MTVILDTDTETDARRLARLRGETVEQAVRAALRAELARVSGGSAVPLPRAERIAKIKTTMEMIASLPPFPGGGGDPAASLYGEDGLPV
ncbi:type II toxin-antitoxin system VapB family antitoxin [Segnochrobactrum spirostomi]|uniref:type II toxin-antitoxin system VapB family antitoxin n=1 Tax=Segnochrobactrum spirostomi TaxID=2608987 RepID=UPI00129757D9|nr:type II toxin-antitoxin system VapB family antitoxin [Segnochrobactrum spirostomi]